MKFSKIFLGSDGSYLDNQEGGGAAFQKKKFCRPFFGRAN